MKTTLLAVLMLVTVSTAWSGGLSVELQHELWMTYQMSSYQSYQKWVDDEPKKGKPIHGYMKGSPLWKIMHGKSYIRYTIVTGFDHGRNRDYFEGEVSRRLNDGWMLAGSPTVSKDGQVCQALTKTETIEAEKKESKCHCYSSSS